MFQCKNGVFKRYPKDEILCKQLPRCPLPDTNLAVRWQTIEHYPSSGFLLKLFKIDRYQLRIRNFPEGWTLVLKINSTNKDLIVGSVNGFNAGISESGNLVSVTSVGNNEIFSANQLKIGNKRYYGVLLRFFNAVEDFEVESASLYFKEFINVDCLENEALTLIDSECESYDSEFETPTNLSLEAEYTCPTEM